MLKLKINNSKPKDWPQIPLMIHNQMCYYEYMISDDRCEAKLISAKFLMLGDDLLVWDFLSSMTFLDFSRRLYFSRFSKFSRPCGNPVFLLTDMDFNMEIS